MYKFRLNQQEIANDKKAQKVFNKLRLLHQQFETASPDQRQELWHKIEKLHLKSLRYYYKWYVRWQIDLVDMIAVIIFGIHAFGQKYGILKA